MEQCESAASLLASVREQERQFERLTRALEEERRCGGTLPRPPPNLQVTPRPHGITPIVIMVSPITPIVIMGSPIPSFRPPLFHHRSTVLVTIHAVTSIAAGRVATFRYLPGGNKQEIGGFPENQWNFS